jgi:L-fucose isomerase-like protein
MEKAKGKIGVFSPNDFREWVRAENIDLMIGHEALLTDFLRGEGYEVVRGGEGHGKMDSVAWNTALVREHVEHITGGGADVLVLNQGSWTFPYDSRDAVQHFADLKRRRDPSCNPAALIFAYQDTQVPGMVAGMAVAGALRRIGIPYHLVYGRIDTDEAVRNRMRDILAFHDRRREAAERAVAVREELRRQKYVAFGGMSLKMCTTTADVDAWAKLFGISYEALDQSELTRRALRFVSWSGKAGESDPVSIDDARVAAGIESLRQRCVLDFSREKFRDLNKLIYQLSYYYASCDLLEEYGGTFTGIKCQDELSASECTMCLATAFLSNDFGPQGEAKAVVPCACENDMDSSLTQLMLSLLSGGKSSGFGDFRDVEKDTLAIVNCGQHPPAFFGMESAGAEEKLSRTEFIGQEVFYHAGGAAVRGRTGGGQEMTIARLARENFRYYVVGTVLDTVDVSPQEHERYNVSWPIIQGVTPISGEELIGLWPCNHLGFVYGDYTPHLVELASRLGIGYRVYDRNGILHEGLS